MLHVYKYGNSDVYNSLPPTLKLSDSHVAFQSTQVKTYLLKLPLCV